MISKLPQRRTMRGKHNILKGKRSFTLFELLLVLLLVGLASGAIITGIPRALQLETFETGVQRIISKLTLAQELMLDYQTDICATIQQDDGGISLRLFSHKPLPPAQLKMLNKQEKIRGITYVSFEGKEPPFSLLFDHTLGTTPKGVLVIKGHSREVVVTLRGYPAQILRGNLKTNHEEEAIYPQEVLSFT